MSGPNLCAVGYQDSETSPENEAILTALWYGSFSKKTSKESACAVMIRINITFANQKFL